MTSKLEVLQRRKAQLIQNIVADRAALQQQADEWHQITSPLDQSWQNIMRYRSVIFGITAVIAVSRIRKPLHLLSWTRKALSLWTSYQLFKRSSDYLQK